MFPMLDAKVLQKYMATEKHKKNKLKRYAALLMAVMISVVSIAGCGISYV